MPDAPIGEEQRGEDDVPLDVHAVPPRAFATGEDDRADRGQQQQDRGGLEGQQELLEQQAADRGGVAEAGVDVGAVGAERQQGGGEDGDRELDEEGDRRAAGARKRWPGIGSQADSPPPPT